MTMLTRRLFQKASKSKLSLIRALKAMTVVMRAVALVRPLATAAPVAQGSGGEAGLSPRLLLSIGL